MNVGESRCLLHMCVQQTCLVACGTQTTLNHARRSAQGPCQYGNMPGPLCVLIHHSVASTLARTNITFLAPFCVGTLQHCKHVNMTQGQRSLRDEWHAAHCIAIFKSSNALTAKGDKCTIMLHQGSLGVHPLHVSCTNHPRPKHKSSKTVACRSHVVEFPAAGAAVRITVHLPVTCTACGIACFCRGVLRCIWHCSALCLCKFLSPAAQYHLHAQFWHGPPAIDTCYLTSATKKFTRR